MNEEIQEKVKSIKRSFRLLMNGVTSRSMREKGLEYKLNWGASIGHLQAMAEEYGKDYELATALWKEDIRECKILAAMIMPAESMLPEVADIWVEQTRSQEIAEITSFYLYRFLPSASDMALRWISSAESIHQICGYNVLARLFRDNTEISERDINEFVDQALSALQSPSLPVRRAAMKAIGSFTTLGDYYEKIAETALNTIGLELF